MGKHRTRTKVTQTYKQKLKAWAQAEQAQLGGISQRDWADRIKAKTGVEISYTIVGNWLNADTNLHEEMSERALTALSRWRGDPSPEATRNWLWEDTLYDSDQVNRVKAWIRSASRDDVAAVWQEATNVLMGNQALQEQQLKLPELAIRMKEAGISLETLLERSFLTSKEKEIARQYLNGEIDEISEDIYRDLDSTLKGLIKLRGCDG